MTQNLQLPNDKNIPIILFDGVCNFCNSSINFVIDRDVHNKFYFASLQSEFGKKLLLTFGEANSKLDTVVLIKEGKLYKKSTAALEIARELRGAWKLMYALVIIPEFIRDFIYDLIARNRYKWFGKKESCRIPDPQWKHRFLG